VWKYKTKISILEDKGIFVVELLIMVSCGLRLKINKKKSDLFFFSLIRDDEGVQPRCTENPD
jgi:hypothetical protein